MDRDALIDAGARALLFASATSGMTDFADDDTVVTVSPSIDAKMSAKLFEAALDAIQSAGFAVVPDEFVDRMRDIATGRNAGGEKLDFCRDIARAALMALAASRLQKEGS